MDDSGQVVDVLAEFARTMVTDFPINAILDRLVERIVEVLPIAAAGVTLMSDTSKPHFIAASNEGALQLEKLQSSLGHGPCVLAYESGEAVTAPDIRQDARFEDFAFRAADVGLVGVFAFPLRHNDGRLGALDLFCSTAGPLDEWAMSAAQTLADVAAAYLVNAQARQQSSDVTELLRSNTLHDALTGLPNRVMLQERLQHAAERAQRSHATAAVLFADLDGFKEVNDTYGHPVGDALLVAVAHRLKALLRPGDTVARVSGDEFVVLCEDLASIDVAGAVAARITLAYNEPFTVTADGEGVTVDICISASVGIAFAGHADEIGVQLIRDADKAMYQVKRRGGAAAQVVDVHEATELADRVALEHDLQEALERGELSLAYQPIVRVVDGQVSGVEALLRWQHPTRGAIPALRTVALAEQSALIHQVGDWVLGRAILDRSRWLREHPGHPLELAVNVSPRQLMAAGFASSVDRSLRRADMEPGALTLEITESIFVEDTDSALDVLSKLKEIGVHLALDDFGTGYSSLSYLRQFPVDIVKIDQAFVAEIGVKPTGGAIIAAVTDLAHVLGLRVTAEGVETEQQREKVVTVGCDSAQGYLYARPMSADQISKMLTRQPSGMPQGATEGEGSTAERNANTEASHTGRREPCEDGASGGMDDTEGVRAALHDAVTGAATALAAANRLCEACVELLGVDGAAISLVHEGTTRGTFGSSDELSRRLDELQFTFGEGPCLDAVSTGRPVLVQDLNDPGQQSWPAFTRAVLDSGVYAVFGLPVAVASFEVGALNLYRSSSGPLSPEGLLGSLVAAKVAAEPLLRLMSMDWGAADDDSWDQLASLERNEVYQATGMIMIDLDVDPAEALVRLRGYAFAQGLTANEAAWAIVDGQVLLGSDTRSIHPGPGTEFPR